MNMDYVKTPWTAQRLLLLIIKILFIGIIAIFCLFPVSYIILGAFKSNKELMTGGSLLPKTWVWTNFTDAWNKANFALYTFNSLIYCVSSMVGALFISSMAGYCVARKEFPFKGLLVSTYYATMFITLGAVIYRPLYLMMVNIGWNKSLFGVILIQIGAQGSNVFLVSKFVRGVSTELDEAARIDGCSTFRTYWNIILPLIRPILGVVALFSFKDAWNAYILPSIFTLANKKLMTLTVGVVNLKFADSTATQWNIMVAGATMAVLPMLIVYILANKQFISGLTAGSVKG